MALAQLDVNNAAGKLAVLPASSQIFAASIRPLKVGERAVVLAG